VTILTRRRQRAKEEDVAEEPVTAEDEAVSKSNPATAANDRAIEATASDSGTTATTPRDRPKRAAVRRVLVFGLLPGLLMLLAGGVGYVKWDEATQRETQSARIESVQAATDSTIKILSYSPDTVERDLDAAQDRLAGSFRDSYTELTHTVVIPGAKEKKISAVATVPAAASISASSNRAVVIVFVNQTTVVGNDAPSSTASTVRVTMEKQDNHWLITDFTPV
jgi:Mce-associated membrane protein